VHAAQVAVVGSRHPTAGGERHARRFARHLAQSGLGITSGLARGIDAAAHEGAIDGGGLTVAVCGTGLDECYPARNARLAARIVETGGALVSEFPPRTLPRADHFPRRNRIISGLARGVLVVEAARDSGSLITARLALEQGRELMVVPGSIDSPVSAGCHALIRNGAALVQNVDDVLFELRLPQKIPVLCQDVKGALSPVVSVRRLDKPREMLLDALGFEPASIDDLIARTGHTAQDIAVRLTQLELDGLVETLPGGRYGRLPLPPVGK
jgi:DNA processing protein